MFRRSRPTRGRHPPPIAPTYSVFKPRSEWNSSGASMFLYINLPGFDRDQIEIKSDEKTRKLQIQGERPLSTQTWARFNETYRVPASCDMSKERMQISFSRGLLTIEMPIVPASVAGGSSERKKPVKDEKLAEEKKAAEVGRAREKADEEDSRISTNDGSSERKKPVKDEKLVDEKEVIDQKVSGEEGRRSVGEGSLRLKQPKKDEKPHGDMAGEEKEAAAVNVGKPRQKVVEEDSRISSDDGSLGRKQPAKDKKLAGEMGVEGEIQERVKPGEADLGRGAEKRVNGEIENVSLESSGSTSNDLDKKEVNEGEDTKNRTEKVNPESELSRGTLPVVVKDRKDADQNGKSYEVDGLDEKLAAGDKHPAAGEEEMMKRGRGSMEAMAMDDEQREKEKERESLVNVGVAALVIMGFGAYLFVPLLK